MARSILGLPTEILLQIIGGIPNADLDNFTLSCKLFRNVAQNSLRDHQERKRTYSSITYGDPESNEKATTWIHPTLMLRDLQRDDLLCYPTSLSIYGYGYSGAWDDGKYDSDIDGSNIDRKSEVDYALEHFPKDIGPLVKACPYIDGDKELTNAILEGGDSGATLGLLLNILPRLTDLDITDYCEASDGGVNLRQILDRMVSDSNTYMSGAQGESTNSGCKLKTITLVNLDKESTDDEWNLSMYAPLFYTPSVRSIRVEFLTSHEEVWSYPGLRSRVEKLDFFRPMTDIKSMDTYLGAVANLANFRYLSGYVNASEGYDLLLRHLVRLLAVHASHSLRHLELTKAHAVCSRDLFVGSLRTFQVLQSIKIEVAMLIKPLETEETHQVHRGRPGCTQQLADMLPASLMCLTLCSSWKPYRPQDMTDAIQMLRDLPARKIEALPNLKVISLDCTCLRLKEDEMALLRACEEAGVTISDCRGALN
ncbi:MAG: hypothetical protein LQ346_007065 [Caloplaca aetnensis]|nr:MAG: hypothetical protein LQ346_007065 [Caloplaca aetnensis]